jgi:hypothetical protein
MNQTSKKLLLWSPRVLCIMFAVFISMFAMDVFGESHGFLETLAGLLIHLIPTFVIALVLVLSWRWEWVGAIVYIGLGIFYIVQVGFVRLTWIFAISGPLFLIGILFLISWLNHDKLRVKDIAGEVHN